VCVWLGGFLRSFFVYKIIPFLKRGFWFFCFNLDIVYFFFLTNCLLFEIVLESIISNRSDENGYLCFVLGHRAKFSFFFHHSMVVSSGFFIDTLITLNKFPYTLIFFSVFNHERIFGFVKCFFLNALIWSCVCSLLIWCIKFTDFRILNQLSIFRINNTLS